MPLERSTSFSTFDDLIVSVEEALPPAYGVKITILPSDFMDVGRFKSTRYLVRKATVSNQTNVRLCMVSTATTKADHGLWDHCDRIASLLYRLESVTLSDIVVLPEWSR